jgi:predicted NAD/FAD-binding protein
MEIGIVGSGIAGLTAGWILNRGGHHVTILEQQDRVGIDAHSIVVKTTGGRIAIDVPSRMFNELLWPKLTGLYDQIGVDYEPVDASQSFGDLGQNSFLNLQIAFRPRLLAQRLLSSKVRAIGSDLRRLVAQGSRALELDEFAGSDPGQLTFGDYLRQNDYSREFIFDFLYPTLSSTVCTCSYESLDKYPAEVILRSLYALSSQKHVDAKPLMRTKYGTRDVAQRLRRDIENIRFGSIVKSAVVENGKVLVEVADKSSRKQDRLVFDHLIVATQANQALNFLTKPTIEERNMLSSFRYENIPVVVHCDKRLMPPKATNWSTFNMITNGADGMAEGAAAMCSVWVNRFYNQGFANQEAEQIFQTICPLIEPEPSKVRSRTGFQRPVVDEDSILGLERLGELQREPNRRIWFCGSYAGAGVPLLESGVDSALRVAQRLGVDVGGFFAEPATQVF